MKALTVEELTAILEESDSSDSETENVDIVYIPPEVTALTDEEDIDDNLLTEDVLEKDIAGTFEIHGKENSKVKISKTSKNSMKPNWNKTEYPIYSAFPTSVESACLQDMVVQYGELSPFEIFSLFVDNTLLKMIADFSKKYANSNNRHNFVCSETELKKFLGILFLSGYNTFPQQDMFWSTDEDKGVDLVKKAMSRNRFREIKRNLHVSDNSSLDKRDKFSKLRPFIEYLNKKFIQFGIFSHNLSIDEQMVPYFGRHSAKMFIKGKPVRFGFKIWCLCSSNGYLYQFQPYGGHSNIKRCS